MNDDYNQLRKEVEERVIKREKAREDLIGFLVIDGFLWVVWLIAFVTGVGDNIANKAIIPLLFLTVIWGLSAVGTWLDETYGQEEREERIKDEVEKEVEREMAKRGLTEKPKRLELSDDGELIDIIEEEQDFSQDHLK